jgi:hypothetical protein
VFAALVLLAAVIAPCKSSSALGVFVEADPVDARDTIMTARVCLAVPATQSIASLSGRLTLDTAFGRLMSIGHTPGSPFVANADSAGNVMIAGASGSGVRAGTVLTLRTRLTRAGVLPRIDFTITELNALDGSSLVTRATARGLAPRCVGKQPAVFEVLPPGASADPGEPLDLRISGCGFDALHNTVRVGEITVRDIRSTEGGTRIRVVIPKEYRATGEVPPMVMGAGTYEVTVDNGRGRSNARRITLR